LHVSFQEIQDAFEFVSAGGGNEHHAFLCKATGAIHYHSDLSDDFDPLPDDIEDGEKFIPIPDKRELDLGKPLALAFAREFLAEDFDEARWIFGKRGAYAQFKGLLECRGALDHWYAFEAEAEEKALRAWCAENSIEARDE
jgi:hypothetical protein